MQHITAGIRHATYNKKGDNEVEEKHDRYPAPADMSDIAQHNEQRRGPGENPRQSHSLIIGRHDVNAPTKLADDYYNILEAPEKELVWFEHSGHGPWLNETEKFVNETLRVFHVE